MLPVWWDPTGESSVSQFDWAGHVRGVFWQVTPRDPILEHREEQKHTKIVCHWEGRALQWDGSGQERLLHAAVQCASLPVASHEKVRERGMECGPRLRLCQVFCAV